MKTLSNCTPTEFLSQTAKIRKSVERWLEVTDIMAIRKRVPSYEVAPPNATAEERAEVIKRNADREAEQVRKNVSDILFSILEKNPEETLELLALCCFVEPKDIDTHPMDYYLEGFYELLNSPAVLSFFTLLAQLAKKNT